MYTIGELAEVAGVTTKALRIYEKKGIIKSIRHQGNNYRLYDEETKLILQKVVTLKFLGFSLNQIKEFLENNREMSLEESLQEQRRLLMKKRNQLDRVVACMNRAIGECQENQLDIDELLESMKHIVLNQKMDEMYTRLVGNSAKASDWNVWVYEQADIRRGERILDAGAGYGNLWRLNLQRLPEDVRVTCIDRHNTHADEFVNFVADQETSKVLPKKCFSFLWGDMEEMEIGSEYDCIFFNHTIRFMENGEKMIERFCKALRPHGRFICTWGGKKYLQTMQEWMWECGVGEAEANAANARYDATMGQWEEWLASSFAKVERHAFEIELVFDGATECLEFIGSSLRDMAPVIEEDSKRIVEFLASKENKEGKIILPRDTYLYICRNGE